MLIKSKKTFCSIFILIAGFVFCFAQEKHDLPEQKIETDSEINPKYQSNLVVLENVHPHNLNPHTTSFSSDSQILEGIYEGLFTYNPINLEPQYAIANDYKLSRDKKRMTFTLRKDAYFSNGEQITAKDVRNSWLQMLSTPDAPYASLLDIIKGVTEYRMGKLKAGDVGIYVLDDFTLSVHLNSPANYLPRVLCHSAFSVIHRNPSVFSGPYVIEDQEDAMIILSKNPYYWDKENTHLEHITFIQSGDEKENTYLFNAGSVDWIIGTCNVESLLNKDAFQYNAEFGTSFLFFNLKNKNSGKFNPWEKLEFRQAVMEAFPWENMRKGAIIPATTLVYPLTGYPSVQGYSYTDLNEAKELMKQARIKYGIAEDEILPLVLDIQPNMFLDERRLVMHQNLGELGIDLQFRAIPSNIYFSNVKVSDADMFMYSWLGDFADPLTFLELFRSDSSLNDSGWKNKDYDALLEEAACVSNEERYNILAKAESILMDEGVVLPLYYGVAFNVIDMKEIGGWAPNAFDAHPLKYIFKKAPKTNVTNIVMLE